MKITMEN
jgi:hypothetical protein